MNHIIIEGFMGSGKSKVGRILAKNMELPYIDVDKLITTKMKMSVNDIFERFGEAYFRAIESFVLKQLLDEKKRSIICIGGGVATMEQNLVYLKQMGKVVYLKKPVTELVARLEEKRADDPFFKGARIADTVKKMLAEREPYYKKAADVILDAKGMTPEQMAAEIQKQFSLSGEA